MGAKRTRRLRSADVFKDESLPLSVRRHDDHGPCGVHSHEFHELVVILAGHGLHIAGREQYRIEAGDVFVIRGQMAHGYGETEGMRLVNILFDPKRLRLPFGLAHDMPGYHALFMVEPELRGRDRFRSRLRLGEEELAEAAGMIVMLQQELERRQPGYRFLACSHLMRLIGFLSRCYSREARPAERPLLRVGEVLSFIAQHYKEPLTLAQLARVGRMSERSLVRAFRGALGQSPIEHVIRVRLSRASELLARGDVRVTEAAFECGFNDSNYFSRQFRKVMGVSPREYRARHVESGIRPHHARRTFQPCSAGAGPGYGVGGDIGPSRIRNRPGVWTS